MQILFGNLKLMKKYLQNKFSEIKNNKNIVNEKNKKIKSIFKKTVNIT